MRLLDGNELAGYVKERQAKQVRNLRQSYKTAPKLAIIQTVQDEVIDVYVRMKKNYGADILVDVMVVKPAMDDLPKTIAELNADESVHGIIVQLPIADDTKTDEVVKAVAPDKDVDGLGENPIYTPATAMAIDWLAQGYNVQLSTKKIAIVGKGRLVGGPLATLWNEAGFDITTFDKQSEDTASRLKEFDIVVASAGVPGLITNQSIKDQAVIIDAATSSEHGKVVGDVADEVRERPDVTITPLKGGVGPLTVCALFDNVIRAARATTL